jgi:hypothetical protein
VPPIDPSDYEARLETAGIDPESLTIRSMSAYDDWRSENDEWVDIAGREVSLEGAAILWAAGAPAADSWSHLLITGTPDQWSVEIRDIDGNTYDINLGYQYDYVWDFYDYADIYDVDTEKDIDTGEPGS